MYEQFLQVTDGLCLGLFLCVLYVFLNCDQLVFVRVSRVFLCIIIIIVIVIVIIIIYFQ